MSSKAELKEVIASLDNALAESFAKVIGMGKEIDELARSVKLARKNTEMHNEIAIHLQNALDAEKKMNEHLERTLKSCESACQFHVERADKAFEMLGRMMVEGEL